MFVIIQVYKTLYNLSQRSIVSFISVDGILGTSEPKPTLICQTITFTFINKNKTLILKGVYIFTCMLPKYKL